MEFRDLKVQYGALKHDIDNAIQNVLNGGVFIGGTQVKEFERDLADYVGVKHCVSCANGTDALSLVLMAWNIGAGDAVFVPDFTFFATGEVVAYEGATPVFVDVDADTFNLDPNKLEATIEKTIKNGRLTPKAIIPVDLFGLPADYIKIKNIAEKYGLFVLEDGAQGFGGMIEDNKACSFGDAATTSFFPAKPLGCYGDGGAVFTNDDALAEYIRSVQVHGKGTHKYENVRIGLNSRLDTIQAGILQAKFSAFRDWELTDVNKCARYYTQELNFIVKTPVVPGGYFSSWAQYTITLRSREQRDNLLLKLKESNIPSMIYYPIPMHLQRAFSSFDHSYADFSVTTMLCDCVLSLPIGPYIEKQQQDEVIERIKEGLVL